MLQKKDNQLKITIYGYDVTTIEKSTKSVVEQIAGLRMSFNGPTPQPIRFPTKKKVVTVPISPHKHKQAQEAFGRKTHYRKIIITNISPADLEKLEKNLKIPNTVGMKLKASF